MFAATHMTANATPMFASWLVTRAGFCSPAL